MAKSLSLERAGETKTKRRKGHWSFRSQRRLPARRAWARQPPTKLHAHPRKGRAALDCGSGSSPQKISAPRHSRPTPSAGLAIWLSSLLNAHSGNAITRTAANAYHEESVKCTPWEKAAKLEWITYAPLLLTTLLQLFMCAFICVRDYKLGTARACPRSSLNVCFKCMR